MIEYNLGDVILRDIYGTLMPESRWREHETFWQTALDMDGIMN